MQTIAFLFCAGIIPVVPLIGAGIFKKRKDRVRQNICWGLFVLQTLLSIGYMVGFMRMHGSA